MCVSGACGGEIPGTGVTEDFESLHGCRESNMDSLEEQPVLLTAPGPLLIF